MVFSYKFIYKIKKLLHILYNSFLLILYDY